MPLLTSGTLNTLWKKIKEEEGTIWENQGAGEDQIYTVNMSEMT